MINPKKILIIDDDEASNYIATRTIQTSQADTEVITVLNGMEAIDYFKNNVENIPNYVLLDVNMPLMNGFEFLTWYNNSVHKGQTKIILFSMAIGDEERRMVDKFEDVVAYIEKPLSNYAVSSMLSNA